MKKTISLLIHSGVFSLSFFFALHSASGEDFYLGKNIRFIVGYAPGGGYDTYTRAIARYMGKYIPGNPSIVVENMEGAGSLLAANYMYGKADPDGLTVGNFNSGMVTQQALDARGIRFDARKFGWIGAPVKGFPACMVMGFTGALTYDDVLKMSSKIKFGGTRAGASSDDLPKIMNALLGTKFEVISGYKGTGPIRVALQRREINGICSGWESMRVTAAAMLKAEGGDKLIPFIIHGKVEGPGSPGRRAVHQGDQGRGKPRRFQGLGEPIRISAALDGAAPDAQRPARDITHGDAENFDRLDIFGRG